MSVVYSYNTRDFKFILKEWLPMQEIFSYDKYKQFYSIDDVDMLIDQVNKVCKEVIAPTADPCEEFGVRFENGKVEVAPEFTEAFKYLQENGWGTSNLEDVEGAIPLSIYTCISEMVTAANSAVASAIGLTSGAARLISEYASEELKERFLPKMMDGIWGGSMCLTEAGGGSDVGDILSKAYPTEEPGIYKIKGSKIFITGGDGDHVDNIIHLLLARVEGAKSGTAGISLFIVPKYWVNEDGSLEPNDVQTTAIENKMGLHGQPTAALAFGEDDGCRGWLLGVNPLENEGKGDGMAQMFQMMNEERQGTGAQALCLAANAYWNAKEYCKTRVQGRSIINPKGPRVEIINHEDIKRLLMTSKATTEACRAMICKTYYYIDIMRLDPDPQRKKWARNRIECLTPVCKAYPSDEAWSLIGGSIQAYGGYGFMEDYPVAQAARDVKVYSIWEGTNFIQSMDLVGRKWTMQKGAVFADFIKDIEDFIANKKENAEGLEKQIANLEKALQAYRKIQLTYAKFMKENKFQMIPLFSHRVLTATGQLYGAYCLLDQAIVAQKTLNKLKKDHYDYNFYLGKVLAAKFYVHNVLPNVGLVASIVSDEDSSVIKAPVEIFEY